MGDGVAVQTAQESSAAGAQAPVAATSEPAPRDGRASSAWLLGSRVRAGLITLLAVLVVVLLVRPTQSTSSRDFSALAAQLNTALSAQQGVTATTAGYLPGTGIILVSTLTGTQPGQLNAVLGSALNPFSDQLADLPTNEAVSWQVSSTGASGTTATTMVRIAGVDVLDQTRWVLAATAGAATAPSLDAGAAAAGPSASSPATSGTASASSPSAAPVPAQETVAIGAPVAAGAPTTDDFSADTKGWLPLTGSWKFVDGTYQQTDNSGYDFISQLKAAPPAAYRVSITLTGLADSVNAGLLIGQPAQGSRKGATIIDLAGQDYLRWGSYDASSGTYKFIGGSGLGSVQDPATPHVLAVTVDAAGTTVEWDGAKVGTFAAVGAGYLGLVTSQSAVKFDDLSVTAP